MAGWPAKLPRNLYANYRQDSLFPCEKPLSSGLDAVTKQKASRREALVRIEIRNRDYGVVPAGLAAEVSAGDAAPAMKKL